MKIQFVIDIYITDTVGTKCLGRLACQIAQVSAVQTTVHCVNYDKTFTIKNKYEVLNCLCVYCISILYQVLVQ